MIDPDDGDEQVAHSVADHRVPQRPEGGERRVFRCFEFEHHDGHDHGDDRV